MKQSQYFPQFSSAQSCFQLFFLPQSHFQVIRLPCAKKRDVLEISLNWLTSIVFKTWPAHKCCQRTTNERKGTKLPLHGILLWFCWIGKWVYGQRDDPGQIRSLSVERFEKLCKCFCFQSVGAYLRLTRKHTFSPSISVSVSCSLDFPASPQQILFLFA